MNSSDNLALLSVSHNCLTDENVLQISKSFPSLRCLNLAYNQVSDIRKMIVSLKKLNKLKILSTFGNSISLLAVYYGQITNALDLKLFDNENYVRPPEPSK